LLVHNAGIKDGCSKTEDGFELSMQVNYMAPHLLTQLLLPSLQKSSARVVHVTCDAGLTMPDYLPWPLKRTDLDSLPRVDLSSLESWQEGEGRAANCAAGTQYANAKLALLVHSHELNRRHAGQMSPFVSHAVNPGAMDSNFGSGVASPTGRKSARGSMMSKLPPVWIANQIYSYTLGPIFSRIGGSIMRYTLRSPRQGAKAVFHVATFLDLGDEENGGGMFSDTAGAFVECGLEPGRCGRVRVQQQPMEANDEELGAELWERTEQAMGSEVLLPVPVK